MKKTIFFYYGMGLLFLLFLTAAKCVQMEVSPENAKQGDNISVKITANEASKLDRIEYTLGSTTGTTTSSPFNANINTCKTSGNYQSSLILTAKAFWNDGTVKTTTRNLDLTVGPNSREDSDKNYVTYIADENDSKRNDIRSGQANAFQDEFDAYSETQYFWAEPRFFTTDANSFVNSADMAFFLGHGNHHQYRAGPTGSDWVNFTNTEFGNFIPCGGAGDCEILVSGACQLLSLNNDGGHAWRYFWRHENSSKLDKRAFTGLHMICGFRTNHHYTYWWWGRWKSSSEGFFKSFAKRLDNGNKIRDAWLDAAGDKLDFDDGNNRAAVFYLKPYENDAINTLRDDYIFGNPNYQLWAEYWD